MVVSLYLLFEVLSTIFCLHYLYGEKIKLEIKTVGVIVCEVSWMKVISIFNLNHNLSWIIYPVIILYCCIRFGFCIKAIFINNILWMMIVSILQVTMIFFLRLFFKISYIGNKETLIINMLVFLFVAFVIKRWKIEKISNALQINEKLVIVSFFMIMSGIISSLTNYRNKGGFNIIYYIVIFVGFVMFFITVIDIAKSRMKAKEIERELQLHKLYQESFQNLIDEIRARQHEFDNHINVIYSQHYLYRTYEELVEVQKKYCKNIVAENSYNKLLSKGNSIVIGFLYSKFSEAERLGIHIDYKVQIGDMKSNVPMHKIIELLGNLLNNAMEALTGYEELNQMRVVILEQTHEIAINVSNECKNIEYEKMQNFFIKGYSEKDEKRGYGLYNVKKICEEYNIVMESVINQNEGIDWLNYMLIINKKV